MGAPDPRDGAARSRARRRSTSRKGRQFWALQPPKRTPPPAVKDAAWPRADIDRFLLAGLEAKGLTPVADADKRTLLRRVYFDLIGLPPTPEEIEARSSRTASPEAFATVVDRLLASPQFGERWGRHWLDVARYAESSRQGGEHRLPARLALPRLRHRGVQRGQAVRSIHPRADRRRLAARPATTSRRPSNSIATGFLALGPKA